MAGTNHFDVRALYLQVRDALLERIVRADWRPGDVMPNEVALAREMDVSVGTVRRALELLEQEQIIFRRQGRGTFVRDALAEDGSRWFASLRDSDGKPLGDDLVLFESEEATADEAERKSLNLAPNASVLRLGYVRQQASGEPFMVERVSLAVPPFPALADEPEMAENLAEVRQEHGIFLISSKEILTVALSDAATAEALSVDPGTPLLRLERLLYDASSRPVERWIGLCKPDGVVYQAVVE